MAEPALKEPSVEDDGFTPEERQQFEQMREPEAPPPEPAPETPPPEAVAQPAVVDPSPSDDDDDEPAAAAPQPGAAPAQQQPRRVNYQKFARLEQRYKDLQKQFNEREQTNTRLDERLRLLNEALATPQQTPQEEDPEPDPEKDIFGHNAWLKRQFTKQQQALEEIRSGRQSETEETQIARTYEDDARIFASREPNFVPAYQHLMNSRLAELAMYYFGKDVTEEGVQLSAQEVQRIKQTAAQEERQLVQEALQQGQSPAQRVFQLARARGFRPQAAAPAAQAAPGNGAVQPAKPNGAAAQPSVTDEIAKIKQGQAAALTLSGGGGVPSNPMTAEKLANMSQEEFNRLMDTLEPDEWRTLMEGR